VETRPWRTAGGVHPRSRGINARPLRSSTLALSKALAAGQKNVILDLRGNLGGYVADAVKMASEFIPSGTIAYQQDSSGKTNE
jgi:C-terminal processing protease CtpA/Prc